MAGDEDVFPGISQLMKKGFGRVIGPQALALIHLTGGFKQWPEDLRRFFGPVLAAVKNLRDLDVVAREPLREPFYIGSPLAT